MIIVRAPLRISFVGGGTDLPDFYRRYSGRVISATIDRYVYVVINHTPLLKGITARYSINETTNNIKELKNSRIRETMLALGIKDNIEIGIFSHLPVGTGLGGSSAFTVALLKGFSAYLGKRFDKRKLAELACKLEIDKIKEPIGKQDQYATSFGGFNIFQFNPNDSVEIEPVFLDFKKRIDLENHIIIFFTGITRAASSVLMEQKINIPKTTEILKSMARLVAIFKNKLLRGDFETLGSLLHENWLKKKKLSSKVSTELIDKLYDEGIKHGAWGGKVSGAGGGGCIMFLAPLHKKARIILSLQQLALRYKLTDFKEIPVKFTHSGVEVVSNSYLR